MRSYIDTTLFSIYYYFDLRQYGDELLGLARSSTQKVGTDIRPLLKALVDGGHLRKFSHEQYHFWQGLRLPFLHRYALLTFREFMLAAREYSRRSNRWKEWGDLDAISPAFYRLDIPRHLSLSLDSELRFGTKPFPEDEKKIQFTATDLLECAASLFEYQVSCRDPALLTDPSSFKRWRKRRPAYLELFDFAAALLPTTEFALAFMVPLVNAAFHTTKPERAFFDLVCRFPIEFLSHARSRSNSQASAPPPEWHFVIQEVLESLEYDLPYGTYPQTIDIYDNRYYYLGTDWLQSSFGNEDASLQHPVLGPLSAAWVKREKRIPELATLLDYPGYVRSDDAMQFATSAEPTIRVLRLRLEDDEYKVFVLGAADFRAATTDSTLRSMPHEVLQDSLFDIFALYGAVRQALGLEEAESLRRCFHRSCLHYDAACCNGFPAIELLSNLVYGMVLIRRRACMDRCDGLIRFH